MGDCSDCYRSSRRCMAAIGTGARRSRAGKLERNKFLRKTKLGEMELTNEQIARVFAMYLNGTAKKDMKPIRMIDPRGNKVLVTLYALSSDRAYLRDAKLLLKPLSAISDEDAIEVAKIKGFTTYVSDGLYFINHLFKNNKWNGLSTHYVIQFLIQQGYAVPCFIAPNHPLNGRTAIELGIAVDSTKSDTWNP